MVNILTRQATVLRRIRSFKTTLTTPSFKTQSGIRDIMYRRATSIPRTQSTTSRTLTRISERWTSHLCQPNANWTPTSRTKSKGLECQTTPSLKRSVTSMANSVGLVTSTSSALRTTRAAIQLIASFLTVHATTTKCSRRQR